MAVAMRTISVASSPEPIISIDAQSYMTLLPIPDSFSWTNEPWGAALRCDPLAAVASHLFTTRKPPLSTASEWWPVADTLGVRRVVTLTQIHGCGVVVVRRGVSTPRGRPEA